jgi:chromosome segregation ATPase
VNKQQELDKLAHSIKDAEVRLKVFKSNLDTIEKELTQLGMLESKLRDNIKYLRKKHVIALALEYRKSKDELNKTKNRLAMIRIDRENISRASKEVEDFLNKNKESYAGLLKEQNNVIKGTFGRKNGQDEHTEEN